MQTVGVGIATANETNTITPDVLILNTATEVAAYDYQTNVVANNGANAIASTAATGGYIATTSGTVDVNGNVDLTGTVAEQDVKDLQTKLTYKQNKNTQRSTASQSRSTLDANYKTNIATSITTSQQTLATTNNTPWTTNAATLAAAQAALAGSSSAAILALQTGQAIANLTYQNSIETAQYDRNVSRTNNNATYSRTTSTAQQNNANSTTTANDNQQQNGAAEQPQSFFGAALNLVNDTATAAGGALSSILTNFAFFEDALKDLDKQLQLTEFGRIKGDYLKVATKLADSNFSVAADTALDHAEAPEVTYTPFEGQAFLSVPASASTSPSIAPINFPGLGKVHFIQNEAANTLLVLVEVNPESKLGKFVTLMEERAKIEKEIADLDNKREALQSQYTAINGKDWEIYSKRKEQLFRARVTRDTLRNSIMGDNLILDAIEIEAKVEQLQWEIFELYPELKKLRTPPKGIPQDFWNAYLKYYSLSEAADFKKIVKATEGNWYISFLDNSVPSTRVNGIDVQRVDNSVFVNYKDWLRALWINRGSNDRLFGQWEEENKASLVHNIRLGILGRKEWPDFGEHKGGASLSAAWQGYKNNVNPWGASAQKPNDTFDQVIVYGQKGAITVAVVAGSLALALKAAAAAGITYVGTMTVSQATATVIVNSAPYVAAGYTTLQQASYYIQSNPVVFNTTTGFIEGFLDVGENATIEDRVYNALFSAAVNGGAEGLPTVAVKGYNGFKNTIKERLKGVKLGTQVRIAFVKAKNAIGEWEVESTLNSGFFQFRRKKPNPSKAVKKSIKRHQKKLDKRNKKHKKLLVGNGKKRGLTGRRTRINPDDAPENIRALTRENESAVTLAKKGYNVEQNPVVPGLKNPDYRIDGKIYDNFAPSTNIPRNIWDSVKKKIDKKQAHRIVLNLDDSAVDFKALRKQFSDWPIDGLEDLLIIKNGYIFRF